jgi:transcription elongation factor GreA
MNSSNDMNRPSAAAAPSLPMTRDEYRRLEAEIDRLADEVLEAHGNALEVKADADAGTPAVDGQLHLLLQRLETLRRVLPEATVVEPNGAAVIGSRVTVRDSDFTDSYVLVAPGDADLRTGRISPESPLGAALLGRRAGEGVHVTAPAGSRRVSVVQVI